jgi:hypothetical protein
VHPNLIAALVDDRRMFCACGAVPSQPQQLCRSCFVRTNRPSRSRGRDQVNWCVRTLARTLAAPASMLHIFGKGTRS